MLLTRSLIGQKATLTADVRCHALTETCRSDPIFDVLIPLYFHWNLEIRRLAMEIYVRRSYTAYEVSDLHIETFYRASSEEESGHTFDSSDRDNLSVMDLLAPSETETFAVCRWKFRPTQRAAPLRVDVS